MKPWSEVNSSISFSEGAIWSLWGEGQSMENWLQTTQLLHSVTFSFVFQVLLPIVRKGTSPDNSKFLTSVQRWNTPSLRLRSVKKNYFSTSFAVLFPQLVLYPTWRKEKDAAGPGGTADNGVAPTGLSAGMSGLRIILRNSLCRRCKSFSLFWRRAYSSEETFCLGNNRFFIAQDLCYPNTAAQLSTSALLFNTSSFYLSLHRTTGR